MAAHRRRRIGGSEDPGRRKAFLDIERSNETHSRMNDRSVMKANKILKRITKIEALISRVTERSSPGAPHIQELLREVKTAIARAKKAVSSQASSGTATKAPAKHSEPTSRATPEPSKPKRKLSAVGRRAISEATKKRWAAKRAAAKKLKLAVAKKSAVKKVAAKKATPVKAAKKSAPARKAAVKKSKAKEDGPGCCANGNGNCPWVDLRPVERRAAPLGIVAVTNGHHRNQAITSHRRSVGEAARIGQAFALREHAGR